MKQLSYWKRQVNPRMSQRTEISFQDFPFFWWVKGLHRQREPLTFGGLTCVVTGITVGDHDHPVAVLGSSPFLFLALVFQTVSYSTSHVIPNIVLSVSMETSHSVIMHHLELVVPLPCVAAKAEHVLKVIRANLITAHISLLQGRLMLTLRLWVPSVLHFLKQLYPVMDHEGMEPLPAVAGWEAGSTLDRSPADHWVNCFKISTSVSECILIIFGGRGGEPNNAFRSKIQSDMLNGCFVCLPPTWPVRTKCRTKNAVCCPAVCTCVSVPRWLI